jgi:hypothetical protein
MSKKPSRSRLTTLLPILLLLQLLETVPRVGSPWVALQETAELPSADKTKPTEEAFFRRLHLIFRQSLADGSY